MAAVLLIAAVSAEAAPPAAAGAVLERSCVGCHQGAKAPMGLDFKALDFELSQAETFRRWVRIYDAVDRGSMPPGGGLASAPRKQLLGAVGPALIAHEKQTAVAEGRAVLRRLNRYEYENTVRDLLGAPWLRLRDSLPEDGISHRFNKSGEALDISHVQMARYMDTAEQALRDVLAAQAQPPGSRRYYAREQKRFLNRMRYSPFNRSPERATIPILGFDAQPDALHERIPITVGAADPATRELEGYATPASTYTGNEYHFDEFQAPVGGRYRLRMNAFSLWLGTVWSPPTATRPGWWRPGREKTERGRNNEPLTLYAYRPGGEKRFLATIDLTPEPTAHTVEVSLLAGDMILPDAARLFRSRPGWVGSPHASKEGMPGVAYRWMEVAGPLTPPAVSLVPVDASAVEAALREFASRAFRRKATDAEVATFTAIARARLEKKATLADAMIAGYTAILCSPAFLYLEERPGALPGAALANRLSYFLWNAAPDAELVAAAARLTRPAVLKAQVERLLSDARSAQFLDAFLDYWLDLRKLGDTTPDQILYPEYYLDDLLTESAEGETRQFFRYLMANDLPARTLVAAPFTMLNEPLARHYGLPPVAGSAMRKVDLPQGSVRGGLLTQASVLKLTANGTTTSPVLRGVWVMERILGQPPPPPPPGAGAVEPDTRGATTIREQLDKHRSVPACAGCHRNIDPPGFALESFDILGAERTKYRSTEQGEPVEGIGKNGHAFTFKLSQPVDASGEFRGPAFRDIRELKQVLLRDERLIARNMVNQFVTYATGAPAGFAGRAEVERILDRSQASGYGLRTLVHNIVQSELFLRK